MRVAEGAGRRGGGHGAGELFAGRFRLEREAGAGGMGIIYRALDEASGVPVALKVVSLSDEASRRRFAVEATSLERLRHPAVVRFVAQGVSDEG
ncbi:MAG TPA: hypothetical protein VFS00_24055, partial [Polyangiaceae bacterium]|nr:hypothetical protein [Polyangiaceae bacterium]